jgi:small subunit ribosomal protein S5
MVIGNRKGKVGVGVSKGTDVSQAIQKAVADAKKKMITVNLDGNTIAHDIKQKLGSARVLLRPAAEGRGIIAGGAVRTVVELAGVKDVVAKSYGTSNKLNVARCTIEALTHLSAVEQVEDEDTSKKDDKKSQKKAAKKSDKKGKVKPTTAKKDEVKKVATKKATEKILTKKVAKEEEPKKTTK